MFYQEFVEVEGHISADQSEEMCFLLILNCSKMNTVAFVLELKKNYFCFKLIHFQTSWTSIRHIFRKLFLFYITLFLLNRHRRISFSHQKMITSNKRKHRKH